MIMAGKKKNDLGSIIVASAIPKMEKPEVSEAQEVSAHEVAADEVLQAIEAKDPKALAEAMKSLVDMCMHESSESADEESMEHEDY